MSRLHYLYKNTIDGYTPAIFSLPEYREKSRIMLNVGICEQEIFANTYEFRDFYIENLFNMEDNTLYYLLIQGLYLFRGILFSITSDKIQPIYIPVNTNNDPVSFKAIPKVIKTSYISGVYAPKFLEITTSIKFRDVFNLLLILTLSDYVKDVQQQRFIDMRNFVGGDTEKLKELLNFELVA